MKKLIRLLCAVVSVMTVMLFAAAVGAESEYKVYDYSGLLSESEDSALETKLQGIAATYGYDVVVVTVDSLEGHSVESYSRSLYSQLNVGTSYGGVLYLVAMNDREYTIYTNGFIGSDILTQGICDRIGSDCASYLTSGNYSAAFDEYADSCIYEIEYYNKHGKSSDAKSHLGISILIGAVIGLISVLSMKSGMKTTRPEIMANNYIRKNSFNLTGSRDIFLYSSVTRTKISSSSGGSGSSGSGSHNSSGKF